MSTDRACVDAQGRDNCHLARGPRTIDFATELTAARKERAARPSTSDVIRDSAFGIDDGTLSAVRQGLEMVLPEPTPAERARREQERDDAPMRVPVPRARPNTAVLSSAEIDAARMVKASYTAHSKGFAAAQAQIDASSLRGWTIDTELSSREGLVLERSGQTKVAYRGTVFSSAQDLITDAAVALELERVAPQLRESRLQMEAVQRKYGALPTELFGHSKGGAHAHFIGDRFKIPTTTFNPAVGRTQLTSKSTVPHTIIRTLEDAVSTPIALAKRKSNFTVKAIDPLRGLGDPLSTHALENFTSVGARQPGGIETLMNEGVRLGQQLAHLETLDAMKTGHEQGKSFTQALDDFNRSNGAAQRIDVLEDGSLGPRIHKDSGTVKYWRDSGGSFTAAEQAHLDTNAPPAPREYSAEARALGLHEELTTAQRGFVANLSAEERVTFMRGQRATLTAHTEAITSSVKPHETVIRGMMPKTSSLASGVISGVAAHAVMNVLDPGHRLNSVAAEATEGALAGGMGAAGMAALGGSAALGPEVLAGAAAYVAGAESQKAITSALIAGGTDQDTAEAVGSVSGGAIGGVTAVGVGAGATVLASMAFGAEVGEAVGLVGGPVGFAVGAAAGATIGAAVGSIGYLTSRPDPPPPPPPPAVVAYQQAMADFSTPTFQSAGGSNARPAGHVSITPTVSLGRPGAAVGVTHIAAHMHHLLNP
jgi:hypothetical protein